MDDQALITWLHAIATSTHHQSTKHSQSLRTQAGGQVRDLNLAVSLVLCRRAVFEQTRPAT